MGISGTRVENLGLPFDDFINGGLSFNLGLGQRHPQNELLFAGCTVIQHEMSGAVLQYGADTDGDAVSVVSLTPLDECAYIYLYHRK